MNVSLTDELKEFIQKKIESGQYRSEEAVIEAALERLRDQEDGARKTVPTLDELIDQEFVESWPVRPSTELPSRRFLRRPRRLRARWRVSSLKKSERTASDDTVPTGRRPTPPSGGPDRPVRLPRPKTLQETTALEGLPVANPEQP